MRPKISVIIPVYNAEKTLERTLLSVAGQTYSNLEIICINDLSTDGSIHILKEFAAKDSRFIIVNNSQNMGVGLSRNEGLKNATGEYVGFVDNDDALDPQMYELLCEEAVKGDFDVVKCDTQLHLNNKVTSPSYTLEEFIGNYPLRQRMLALLLHQFPEDGLPGGLSMATVWNRIYKRNFLKEKNILFVSDRELPGDDLIFNLQVLMRTDRVSLVNRALYHYCPRPDSVSYTSYLHKQYKTNSRTTEFMIKDVATDPTLPEGLPERIYYRVCINLQWGIVNEWKRNPHGKKDALKEVMAILRHPQTKKAMRHVQLSKLTIVYQKKIQKLFFYTLFMWLKMAYSPKEIFGISTRSSK